jgi:plasmid stabilization system protein ParE
MRVQYSPRAVADLEMIGERSRRVFGAAVAEALETFIRANVLRVAVYPQSAPKLPERPQVRFVALKRYPFKIFYTFEDDVLTILHIRHTSRRPWTGSDE